jgi:hypothetical protein
MRHEVQVPVFVKGDDPWCLLGSPAERARVCAKALATLSQSVAEDIGQITEFTYPAGAVDPDECKVDDPARFETVSTLASLMEALRGFANNLEYLCHLLTGFARLVQIQDGAYALIPYAFEKEAEQLETNYRFQQIINDLKEN